MKNLLKVAVVCIVALIIVGLVNSIFNRPTLNPTTAPVSSTVDSTLTLNNVEDAPKIENWSYTEQKDNMTDKSINFAECKSTNELNFDFPYEGGSTLTITIRKMDGKNDVILTISKGQFNSPYNSNVSIKFDGNDILKYGYSEAADGSSNYIFLNSPNQIIKKLKAAKHIKIEATYFNSGRQVCEFDVEGLKWDH